MAEPARHYASFGLLRSLQQVGHALRSRAEVEELVRTRAERLARDERRIEARLGGPLRDRRVLVLGPGQNLMEVRYFGVHNRVVGIDLDEIPRGLAPGPYLRALRRNGFGRLAKTLGRKALGVDRAHAAAWRRCLGVDALPRVELRLGDICAQAPEEEAFDVVASWSVFEHLPDPRRAVVHASRALRPGGVLLTGIHHYTSNTGHHDIRAFTGHTQELPLWGHLRQATRSQIHPSAWLNEWRIGRWRELFAELAPGADEFLEWYDEPELRAAVTPELRGELADYTDEELFSTEIYFVWQKPAARASD